MGSTAHPLQDAYQPSVTSSPPLYLSDISSVILCTAVVIIIILGSISNALFVLTMALNPRLRSNTNMFMFNVSLSNFMLSILVMPVSVASVTSQDAALSTALCCFNSVSMTIIIVAMMHSLMYASIYKCLSVSVTTSSKLGRNRTLVLVAASWIFGLVCGLASLSGWRNIRQSPGSTQCSPSYPTTSLEFFIDVFIFFSAFCIPVLITIVTLIIAALTAKRHIHMVTNRNLGWAQYQYHHCISLVLLAGSYTALWLPYITYSLWIITDESEESVPLSLSTTSHLIGFLSTVVHPFLLIYRSSSVRKVFAQLLCFCCYWTNWGSIGTPSPVYRSYSNRENRNINNPSNRSNCRHNPRHAAPVRRSSSTSDCRLVSEGCGTKPLLKSSKPLLSSKSMSHSDSKLSQSQSRRLRRSMRVSVKELPQQQHEESGSSTSEYTSTQTTPERGYSPFYASSHGFPKERLMEEFPSSSYDNENSYVCADNFVGGGNSTDVLELREFELVQIERGWKGLVPPPPCRPQDLSFLYDLPTAPSRTPSRSGTRTVRGVVTGRRRNRPSYTVTDPTPVVVNSVSPSHSIASNLDPEIDRVSDNIRNILCLLEATAPQCIRSQTFSTSSLGRGNRATKTKDGRETIL